MSNSAFGAIIPLLITLILLGVVAVVGYVGYMIAMDVAGETSKKMEKKNLAFGKGGVKVGVRERSAEEVGDSTQRMLYKTWSASASNRPGYQSKSSQGPGSVPGSPAVTPGANTEKRKMFSRSSSSQVAKS